MDWVVSHTSENGASGQGTTTGDAMAMQAVMHAHYVAHLKRGQRRLDKLVAGKTPPGVTRVHRVGSLQEMAGISCSYHGTPASAQSLPSLVCDVSKVSLENITSCLKVHHCIFSLVSITSSIFIHYLRYS